MLKENNSVQTRNDVSKELLLLARYWRRLPTLLKERIVREIYEECGSLRKTARTLGISKTTVYYYTRQNSPLHFAPSGIALEFLKSTLPLLIQQLTRSEAGDDETHKMQGGDELEG